VRSRFVLPAAAFVCLALATSARAQFSGGEPNRLANVHLNEIYCSHAGADDQEFIELFGRAGYSLDFHMVLIVEGDGLVAGTLDRAWVLTGTSMPSDKYFVLGDTAVANVDFEIGLDNQLENGTQSIYLVDAIDQAGVDAILAFVGQDVDPDKDGVTEILSLSKVLDGVGMVDDGMPGGDVIYDGLPIVGPDETFFPAGIFRDGDFNRGWEKSLFLDFDDDANFFMPRTPGTKNTLLQEDIGFGGPGDGELIIFGQPLATGNSATVLLRTAPPSTPVALLIADSMMLYPFKGGLLLPWPADFMLSFKTDLNGQLFGTMPGGLGNIVFFFQAVYVDANQPNGFGITNTVRVQFLD
jgi:hypothetical protein